MTDFSRLTKALISGGWKFFTELAVPGLSGVTFASLFVALILSVLGIRLVSFVFGLSDILGGDTPRTSSTRNPKISKERRHDEF